MLSNLVRKRFHFVVFFGLATGLAACVPDLGGSLAGASGTVVRLAATARVATTFSVSSPSNGATLSRTVVFKGQAGSQWVNVAAYDVNHGYAKIGVDVTPSGGTYAVSVDTTKLANGPAKFAIEAFSTPPGQVGGKSTSIQISATVNNSAAPPAPTPAPTSSPVASSQFTVSGPANGATLTGTVKFRGQAGSQWVNVAAYDVNHGFAKISADTAPANGSFTLSVDTTKLVNGPETIAIEAFSTPPG